LAVVVGGVQLLAHILEEVGPVDGGSRKGTKREGREVCRRATDQACQ
jgi:hypothetical protein